MSVPPFTRAFLKSPSSRGLSAIAELLVDLVVSPCHPIESILSSSAYCLEDKSQLIRLVLRCVYRFTGRSPDPLTRALNPARRSQEPGPCYRFALSKLWLWVPQRLNSGLCCFSGCFVARTANGVNPVRCRMAVDDTERLILFTALTITYRRKRIFAQ